MTLTAQSHAIIATDSLPLTLRASNALTAGAAYLGKMLWPANLAVYYPYPGPNLPAWKFGGASVLLIGVSFLSLRFRRKRAYLWTGWWWYLITLLPVIGLIQVGTQSMADRYTYIPQIGLAIAAAWGGQEIMSKFRVPKTMAVILSGLVLLGCGVTTRRQLAHWRTTRSLYEHTLQVTRDNYWMHTSLGSILAREGEILEAEVHFERALEIRPDFWDAHNNLGQVWAMRGDFGKAAAHSQAALISDPSNTSAYNNLGMLLASQGQRQRARAHYLEALSLEPGHADAHNNLANLLFRTGNTPEAISHYREAIRLRPDHVDAHNNLGIVLAQEGRTREARRHFTKALRLRPNFTIARENLRLLKETGGARP